MFRTLSKDVERHELGRGISAFGLCISTQVT